MSMKASQRKQIADELGESEQYLYQCMTGRAAMRPSKAVEIERRSGGRLTRQMLRPHDYWLHWPDLKAPKPAAISAKRTVKES